MFWAGVLAFASWPLMRLLTRWLNGRQTLAAGLLTGCWMVLVAVPLILLYEISILVAAWMTKKKKEDEA